MIRIKICGICTPADARIAIESGADAIGLNFYPNSPRYVSDRQASDITHSAPDAEAKVGVFVNESVAEIKRRLRELRLDAVQLHGDESAEFMAQLPRTVPVIRAVRVGAEGLAPVARLLSQCERAGRRPDLLLIDARHPQAYGGTGLRVDWQMLAEQRGLLGETAILLAGGLLPDTVANAIHIVRPAGVDVASGVEIEPRRKEPKLVKRFVEQARVALAPATP